MFTRGYAKHPCTQSVCTLGFAVGPSRRYCRERPQTRGPPLVYSKLFLEFLLNSFEKFMLQSIFYQELI